MVCLDLPLAFGDDADFTLKVCSPASASGVVRARYNSY